MNVASTASRIWNLISIDVINPIPDVRTASETQQNSIIFGTVSSEPLKTFIRALEKLNVC